jgi:hypothetical protein
MKNIHFSCLAIMCAVLFFLVGLNPVYGLPVEGDSEVLGSGGASHSQGSDSGNFNADLSYGYYLTPGWEIGFRQAMVPKEEYKASRSAMSFAWVCWLFWGGSVDGMEPPRLGGVCR